MCLDLESNMCDSKPSNVNRCPYSRFIKNNEWQNKKFSALHRNYVQVDANFHKTKIVLKNVHYSDMNFNSPNERWSLDLLWTWTHDWNYSYAFHFIRKLQRNNNYNYNLVSSFSQCFVVDTLWSLRFGPVLPRW